MRSSRWSIHQGRETASNPITGACARRRICSTLRFAILLSARVRSSSRRAAILPTAWSKRGWLENPEQARENRDDLTLEARRAVVDRCLYGVDRDPMAVEMAKLSLWLITMARERPFSFLDHSICEGDSLIGISSLDQLRYLHINPEFGRAVHARTHVDATEFVQPLVQKATALRLELESLPSISVRDAEHKQRLNDEANRLLRETAIIADGVVATAISTASEGANEAMPVSRGSRPS